MIRTLLTLILLCQSTAWALDEDVECPKCVQYPSEQCVTPSLLRFQEEMPWLFFEAEKKGDFDRLYMLAKEYLDLAAIFPCHAHYGNAVHKSNRIFGLIALKNNDITQAENYLIEAGKSTGSPNLNSFGPELDLANELLVHGKTQAVITYLQSVRKYWNGRESLIDEWIRKIKAGEGVKLDRFQPK